MRISRIRLSNFKSFQEIDIGLRPFNVVIGPNASGKSNLVQAFRFIRDIYMNGLENAVSMQGGSEFLPNLSVGSPESRMSISVDCDYGPSDFMPAFLFTSSNYLATSARSKYTLELEFDPPDYGYRNAREELHQAFDLFEIPESSPDEKPEGDSEGISERIFGPPVGHGEMTVTVEGGVPKITYEKFEVMKEHGSVEVSPHIRAMFESERPLPPSISLLESHQGRLVGAHGSMMEGLAIYDFDPRLPKRGSPVTGKADLEEDGSNLAIVLNDITRHEEKSRQFHNLIGELLPFVRKMSVDRFADNSLLVNLRESYAPDRDIPASLLSDGTIGLTAIVIALAFESNKVTFLEEPDRNVHPHLISRLCALMKDMQSRTQIMITTHNAEFVRHADIEDLIFVHRDMNGFSQISRPAESDIVRVFMGEEMGIHDLFIDDFLGVGA